jgi:hypothetical protein
MYHRHSSPPPTIDVGRSTIDEIAHLSIQNPPEGATYLIDPTLRSKYQTIALRASADRGAGSIEWSVDGHAVGTSHPDRPLQWPLTPGVHAIVAADAVAPLKHLFGEVATQHHTFRHRDKYHASPFRAITHYSSAGSEEVMRKTLASLILMIARCVPFLSFNDRRRAAPAQTRRRLRETYR